jgi:ribosomal protein L35
VLIDYLTKSQEFEDVERALDLLSLYELQEMDFKLTKKWKVKALVALRSHYFKLKKSAEARKVNACIIAQLTGMLKRSDLFVHTELYLFCVKELIEAYKLNIKKLEKKHKPL